MSVIIRERERERDRNRDWDDRSSAYRDSGRDRGESFTTVKRYRIPNRDEEDKVERLTVYDRDRDRRSDRGETRGFEETRIVRRERTPEPEPEPVRRVERDIRIERVEREREPEPRRLEREYRYERDVDRLPTRRDPYELERYSRSTEYFPRPDPPQPIIIRQEPQQIIIQEAPRAPIVIPAPQPKEESDFQLIQRSEVKEDRQIARREPTRETPREEEDYYYERRTREVSGGDRGDDDYYEERYNRRQRDVSPGDSISQHGRDRDYSSDDSMVYVRKETRDTYGRDESPHHRRHLAEGAIAGLGAAEILRHHRKREGEDTSGRGSRIGKDLGAAAVGAIGAQAISRARSHHREKSRSRYDSRDRYSERGDDRREGRRKHRKEKDRSRSRSHSRVKQLAGLGLGAAAIAAAVGYARRNNNKNDDDRRSRSRTRRHSTSGVPADDPRNPAHKNKTIAGAGLAGAAVAGLVERARSKSRGGRARSKSRIRTGIPIAAAGLGSAAIAGLYERNQANKRDKQDKEKETRRAERKASRSRSRSVPYEGPRSAAASDPNLIEYGDQPVYAGGVVPDYYNRPASQAGYYNNHEDALVPAAAAGAAYGASRERERRRSISSSGSDRERRRRHRRKKSGSGSRSRSRGLAAAGLAAGAAAGGAALASEHEKRKQRRKEEKRERRRKFRSTNSG